MQPLSEQRSATLRHRLEASAVIAFASAGTFAAVDWLSGSPSRPILLVRLVQLVLAVAAWLYARRVRTWAAVANASLVFVCALTVTAATTAVLRADTQSLPVLVTMITLITATFTSWGLGRQVILCLVAFGVLVANLVLLGELRAAIPYPLLPITVALGVSAWVAAETDRASRARHAAEIALRESEARFRTLAEHAPVPIWMSNRDGTLAYLNPAWGDMAPPRSSLNHAFWRIVHPADREHLLAEARAALLDRRPCLVETRVLAADGSIRWLVVRGVPRFGGDGAFEGHVGTAVDVTESKAEARDLAAAHTAAVEAGRLKSSFLATMSHEIRTPMHGIFGMTELALDTDDDAEREEFIRRARSCARTLMTLLDEILDLSRIEAGRLDLRHEAVDLDEVVQNAVDTVAMASAQKGLDLLIDLAPDVPATIGSDGDRLRQILTNLLANAVKFTEAGEVELRARLRDGALLLAVRDTGVGIPPEARQRIFDPFTQAAHPQRFGGTGLGLAISKRLVGGMGGTIVVESAVGVGTTFEVTLPLREPLGPPLAERFGGLGDRYVLVADANPTRREALGRLLEAYGARVRTAASAVEAEQVVRGGARTDDGPDVALVDVGLGAGGTPIATRLSAAAGRRSLRIVLVCPLRPGAREGVGDTDCRVVTRPVLPTTLLRTLLEASRGLAATGS